MHEDITSTILLPGVDSYELASICQFHFGFASADEDAEQITYCRPSQEWAIKLCYSRDRLVTVLRGPGMADADLLELVNKINAELLTEGASVVASDIVFAQIPVESALDLRPHFQIFPVPKDAPRPHFLSSDHPFVLEFQFTANVNPTLMIER